MTVFIRGLGYVLLGIAVAMILLGTAARAYTAYSEGGLWAAFGDVADTWSPFNIYNYLAVLIAIAPGAALIMWADKRSGD